MVTRLTTPEETLGITDGIQLSSLDALVKLVRGLRVVGIEVMLHTPLVVKTLLGLQERFAWVLDFGYRLESRLVVAGRRIDFDEVLAYLVGIRRGGIVVQEVLQRLDLVAPDRSRVVGNGADIVGGRDTGVLISIGDSGSLFKSHTRLLRFSLLESRLADEHIGELSERWDVGLSGRSAIGQSVGILLILEFQYTGIIRGGGDRSCCATQILSEQRQGLTRLAQLEQTFGLHTDGFCLIDLLAWRIGIDLADGLLPLALGVENLGTVERNRLLVLVIHGEGIEVLHGTGVFAFGIVDISQIVFCFVSILGVA